MVIALVVVFVLLLVATIVYLEAGDLVREKLLPHRSSHEMPLPFLIMPLSPSDVPIGAPATRWAASRPAWGNPARNTAANTVGNTAVADDPEFDDDDLEAPEGATVVFRRPSDEATHPLPGRLKVVAGEKGRGDILFVGSVGEQPQIVLGRQSGPPQKVITLNSPTVSRRHAQMEFVDGRWRIANLSRTNPIMVNDEILPVGQGTARTLSDGDRIELGEVVLRFSAQ